MTDVDRYIADRVNPTLARTSARYRGLSGRARQYRRTGWAKKARRIAIAVAAVLAAALVWGFVSPLGGDGVMIVAALLALVIVTLAWLPVVPEVSEEKLGQANIATLPLQTELWLESQRKALPAPAVKLVDDIGLRLETLGPQLQALDDRHPAAVEIRTLLSEHLPELVRGYRSIPEPMRRTERNGRVPEQQLVAGLGVIEREIAEMSENLAHGDFDRLATQNRFLELKYRETKPLGEE